MNWTIIVFAEIIFFIGFIFLIPHLHKIKTMMIASPTLCDIACAYLFSFAALLAMKPLGKIGTIALAGGLMVGALLLRKYGVRYGLLASGFLLLLFSGSFAQHYDLFLLGLFILLIFISYLFVSVDKYSLHALIVTLANTGVLIFLIGFIGLSWLAWGQSVDIATSNHATPLYQWLVVGSFIILPALCYLCKSCENVLNRFALKELVSIFFVALTAGLLTSILLPIVMNNLKLDDRWSLIVQLILSLPVLYSGIMVQKYWLRFGLLSGGLMPFYLFVIRVYGKKVPLYYDIYAFIIFVLLLVIASFFLNKRSMQNLGTQGVLIAVGISYFFTITVAIVMMPLLSVISWLLAGGYGM